MFGSRSSITVTLTLPLVEVIETIPELTNALPDGCELSIEAMSLTSGGKKGDPHRSARTSPRSDNQKAQKAARQEKGIHTGASK